MDEEILVSREMLKAIGADTRIDILKALKERQKTQSELSKELGLSAPTILEHMNKLEEANLIERAPEDKERKWKYYRLTEMAVKMLDKKKMSVIMILSSLSFAITAALAMLYLLTPMVVSALLSSTPGAEPPPPPVEPTTGAASISSALATLESSFQSLIIGLIMLFLILAIILTLVARWKGRNR